MIRNTSEHNETVKPNDFEMERLRAALPEYFDGDGNFMIDRLQQALQDGDVDLTREGYELKFLGKSYAKYLTSTKTETVVVPDLEHNSKPENKDSENLYIVGDNLDALKHLLGSYAGKVKCIYIDPPYNTGSDGFVYNDDFGFTAPQLVEKVGLTEDEAERVLDLRGKSSHSAWLTFMYPRLQLAKELLTDDGVIFISIDDNEINNLRLICDEILGEQNFQASVVTIANPGGRDYKEIAISHESVLVYGKRDDVEIGEISKDTVFRFRDHRGGFELRELRNRNPRFHRGNRPNLFYPFYVNPNSLTDDGYCAVSLERSDQFSVEVFPRNSEGRDSCWRWGQTKTLQNLVPGNAEESQVVARQKRDGGWNIYEKNRRSTTKAKSVWSDTSMRTEEGTREVRSLFSETVFDHPKPVSLIRRCLELGANPDSLIVDFFSGSATTAHAAFELNSQDGGTRKTILVQLPEAIDIDHNAWKAGFKTIDEVGRERIRRAAAKIKDETGADIDYGFKLYRLNEPSGQVLDDLLTFDPKQDGTLLAGDYVSKFDLNCTPGHDTVLATWLVEDGHGLTTGAQQVTLADYELDVCGDSAYIISPGLTSDDVVELVRQLENGDLAVSRVVVFGYSVTFGVMHELKKNLSVLKSGRTVSVIERL
ncbi:site-specific DNA-methyltransferase [Corynebacterium diphtheriae]|nr:site-specific DNA-methyltransferase [Corynebacterium diphtheriae]CAB0919861.1 site-specific DNA-methyltransferase [Corynebacterium diphtheriae]CAB0934642.1 site-specific DNA-methyltransferase [Corynebacterium diphtheriae]CAB1014082.1 site-specific DNA-methyltransferase [Corynebacterium diphtheriae]CAB1016744.1 site-specific DNA-methyltransferase [Corynebacterium diphtheriae]